jgi:adenylylsulfate reductase subunit A
VSTVERRRLQADLVIIGGGTAGCLAAVTAKAIAPSCRVVIVEKAHVERSGCLAAGVNALNAYLRPDDDPREFVDYVRADNAGLIREDLVSSLAVQLPSVPPRLEAWGVPIPHADDGGYVFRGPRSIAIHGEHLKPLLAARAEAAGARVLNRVVATNYLVVDGAVRGVCGFGLRDGAFYAIEASAVICTTGGAAGLYPPCNQGLARHRTWYPPFNAGSGYAMGIRAGAEMTSFEMRFVPLRVKDVLAPTGTVAQGVKAPQVNALGVEYLQGRGRVGTPERLALTLEEERAGRGPCCLDLRQLTKAQSERLKEAYLEMCPSLVLWWADQGIEPNEAPLKLAGAEPCVVGGHAQAGYWVAPDRRTTLPGLYAAGDVAGGAPKKYVSGSLVEGKIAAEAALSRLAKPAGGCDDLEDLVESECRRVIRPLADPGRFTPRLLEVWLQTVMAEHAGGQSRGYQVAEAGLRVAAERLAEARGLTAELGARDWHELMAAHEVLDRLEVATVLVAHLRHRTETRWPVYQSRADYPERDDGRWRCFVNSVVGPDGDLRMIERPAEEPAGGWGPWH